MRSTMQDVPLSIGSLLRYGTTAYGTSEVSTWTGEGARRATYAEVGRRCAQLAHALRRLGVTGDQRVATFMWNNQEHLEAYFAVPAMGAVLHTLNIRLFPEQLVYIANHAEDHVVIVDDTLVPAARAGAGRAEDGRARHRGRRRSDAAPLERGRRSSASLRGAAGGRAGHLRLAATSTSGDAAAMCYTSGTTGNPKGVVYSHRSTYLHSMAACTGDVLGLSDRDRVLPVVPMFHANAWGLPYAAIMVGADLVMPDRFLQAEPLAKLIETEQPTVAGAVPTIWNDLLHYAREPGSDSRRCEMSHRRRVGCAAGADGGASSSDLGVTILQAWGMTETSPLGSVARPPHGAAGDEMGYRSRLGASSAGSRAGSSVMTVMCCRTTARAVGELEVRGPWVTGGLLRGRRLRRSSATAGCAPATSGRSRLTASSRSPTGPRTSSSPAASGSRRSTLENEMMAHPAVLEAAVVGVPDEKWAERPLAAVVLQEGASVRLRSCATSSLVGSPRWQLPERWAFIDAVPKTSVGKFDKKVLRRQYADGELDVVELGRLGDRVAWKAWTPPRCRPDTTSIWSLRGAGREPGCGVPTTAAWWSGSPA